MSDKKYKFAAISLFFALSAAAAGILSYIYAESLVTYESSSENSVTETPAPLCRTPEEIPEYSEYIMYVKNGVLSVYGGDKLLYKDENADMSAFTDSDIAELSVDGIKFAVRSDIVEILNYLSS